MAYNRAAPWRPSLRPIPAPSCGAPGRRAQPAAAASAPHRWPRALRALFPDERGRGRPLFRLRPPSGARADRRKAGTPRAARAAPGSSRRSRAESSKLHDCPSCGGQFVEHDCSGSCSSAGSSTAPRLPRRFVKPTQSADASPGRLREMPELPRAHESQELRHVERRHRRYLLAPRSIVRHRRAAARARVRRTGRSRARSPPRAEEDQPRERERARSRRALARAQTTELEDERRPRERRPSRATSPTSRLRFSSSCATRSNRLPGPPKKSSPSRAVSPDSGASVPLNDWRTLRATISLIPVRAREPLSFHDGQLCHLLASTSFPRPER